MWSSLALSIAAKCYVLSSAAILTVATICVTEMDQIEEVNRSELSIAMKSVAATSALQPPFVVRFSEDSKHKISRITILRPTSSTIIKGGRKPVAVLADLTVGLSGQIQSLHVSRDAFSGTSAGVAPDIVVDLILWVRKVVPSMTEFQCTITADDKSRKSWRAELQAIPFVPDRSVYIVITKQGALNIVKRLPGS